MIKSIKNDFNEQRFSELFKFSENIVIVKHPLIGPEDLESVNARIEDYKDQMYTPRLRRGEFDEKEELFKLPSGSGLGLSGYGYYRTLDLDFIKSFHYVRLGKKRKNELR